MTFRFCFAFYSICVCLQYEKLALTQSHMRWCSIYSIDEQSKVLVLLFAYVISVLVSSLFLCGVRALMRLYECVHAWGCPQNGFFSSVPMQNDCYRYKMDLVSITGTCSCVRLAVCPFVCAYGVRRFPPSQYIPWHSVLCALTLSTCSHNCIACAHHV